MPVYLDHNATAPLRDPVRAAMEPYLGLNPGNPSSLHAAGQRTRAAVDRARRQVLSLVGGDRGQLIFTGSGTEAVVQAILGGTRSAGSRGRRVALSRVEHAAVLGAARMLEAEGWTVDWIPVDAAGRVDPADLVSRLNPETVLVSVLHAGNETGVIQPIEAIAAGCRERGVLLHVDAVQSAGKLPIRADAWGIDLMSLAAHKLGGPQGIGALWRREGVTVAPLIPGSQEGGLRGGTIHVAGAVGFGAAAAVLAGTGPGEACTQAGLRNRLEEAIGNRIPEAAITAQEAERLPNTVHLTFSPGIGGDLVPALDLAGYAVSAGSACASGSEEPSHVLLAMGIAPDRARTAVRVSFGPTTTAQELDGFVTALAAVIETRREGVR
jgi:cysteine desulfurase